MEKEFVPYELALRMKALGFDEPCFGKFYTKPKSKMFGVDEKGRHYPIKNTSKKLYTLGEYFVLNEDSVIIAPTFSQAFRWFREKHNIDGLLHKTAEGSYYFWITECEYENYNHYKYHNQIVYFKTYEEAELACLTKLIEIVESKSK